MVFISSEALGQEKPKDRARKIPEKARLLHTLREENFNVPDFIYVPAEDFKNENFSELETFLKGCEGVFKVVARSAHPYEKYYKGGTFDSVETYKDLAGILYARKKIVNSVTGANGLSILRQQRFNEAPEIDPEDMGIIVMPYIEGINIMAKMVGDHWEFGYSGNRSHKVQSEPYITTTPHDRKLLEVSEDIQKRLGFRCEIEYIAAPDGTIFVVQAKDISNIETLEMRESQRNVLLDGVRRIRKRRNYRERLIYVMDNRELYLRVISMCEDMVHGWGDPKPDIEDILGVISSYEAGLEYFALRCQRYGVLGLCIQVPKDLVQIANHYLDDTPELQARLSNALNENQYQIDYFLSEADTLIAQEKIRINLCTHDAYGIDTVRTPLWSVYWRADRHDAVVREFRRLGFKTGDWVGIDIGAEERPIIYRL